MWDRNDVDFIHAWDLPPEVVPTSEFCGSGGSLKRVLSRSRTNGAETSLINVVGGQKGVTASAVDIYVLSGSGTLNGEALGVGEYFYAPAGTRIELRPGVTGMVLYCGFWGEPSWSGAGAGSGRVHHLRPESMQWQAAQWSGDVALEPGVGVKVLRKEEDEVVYLAAMLPGWKSPLEEAHPVYEESFKICGDILMGSRGVMREASYFFRSPGVFHGPLYTRGGTMSIIRSDGPTTTEYREPDEEGTWTALAERAFLAG